MGHTDGDRAAHAQRVNLEQQERGDVARQSCLDEVGVEDGLDQYWLQVSHGGPAVSEARADGRAETTQQGHLDICELVAAGGHLACAAHHAVEHGQADVHVHLDDDAARQRLQLYEVHEGRI